MKIVTWNVNSIKARHDRVFAWVDKHEPDVLCLQELKVTEDVFPADAFAERGYHTVVNAQKTYNGVAIASKLAIEESFKGMPDDEEGEQARVVRARFGDLDVLNLYVPNGATVGSDKWDYKLRWLTRLERYIEENFDPERPLVVCGDFNVAPDNADVARPEEWKNTVLCHSSVRDALERLLDWGLVDIFRTHHPDGGVYSWWDYRQLGFPKNNGLRIDLILGTEAAAETSLSAQVDRDERKGKQPSDHAPVVITLDW